ncbi:hypothetical protein PAP_08200 [Palaeococcus pacificus DY20341]|uniref:Beta-phosphoglucomutase n=1 Tax=Palaeococcus pacificus DY20341 TaxID=1343739 RepID=A0A075LZL5_9EURY|nr:HAD family hydrolase [Palaeococcus pacificus]AIF70028.1 hypothetical protein PAP_08200 [Palaeococcus pacificus DY20341]
MKNIGIVWDFDGVLVFTPHEEAWRRAAKHYGVDDFDHEFYVQYVSGKPRYEGADNILMLKGVYDKFNAKTDEEKQKLLHEFAEFKNKIVNDMFENKEYEINENAIAFLIQAKEAGIKHALASASKNAAKLAKKIEVEYKGQKISLNELFDINVSGLAPNKKLVFEMALEKLKIKFPELRAFLVVEDAPTGVKAGKELGMITLGYVREAKLDADLTFRDFSELSLEKIVSLIESKGVRL